MEKILWILMGVSGAATIVCIIVLIVLDIQINRHMKIYKDTIGYMVKQRIKQALKQKEDLFKIYQDCFKLDLVTLEAIKIYRDMGWFLSADILEEKMSIEGNAYEYYKRLRKAIFYKIIKEN